MRKTSAVLTFIRWSAGSGAEPSCKLLPKASHRSDPPMDGFAVAKGRGHPPSHKATARQGERKPEQCNVDRLKSKRWKFISSGVLLLRRDVRDQKSEDRNQRLDRR